MQPMSWIPRKKKQFMNDKPIIVIDVGVGKSIESWLAEQGFQIISILKINPRMEDERIIDLAFKNKAGLLITMDKDFGELTHKTKNNYKGILLLRLEDASAEEKLTVVQFLFTEKLEALFNHFSVYKNGIFRVKKI